MGDMINLRTVRKQAKRRDASERAAANRLLHGTPKAERERAAALRDKAHNALEQHRIDPGEMADEIPSREALDRDRGT